VTQLSMNSSSSAKYNSHDVKTTQCLIETYLNNSKAEVAFIEHNDFVLICAFIKHMPAAHTKQMHTFTQLLLNHFVL